VTSRPARRDEPDLRDLVPIPDVWDRLERVEQRLYEVTETEDPFLTKISQHLLGAGGKRYRPLLAQVAGELGPDRDAPPVEAGVSVELVHLGSLYHDDVIDEADTRRAAISVNANWTNTVAILAGDFLLARASEVAAPLGEEAVALLARTYANLCEGQVLELQLTGDVDHGPDEYFKVIGGKTASLIRTSARLGALSSGAPREIVDAVSAWAWEMGLVFQMTDDVLDLVATEEFLGKPAGSDIREGTFTLPVLLAARSDDGDEITELLAPERERDDAAIARVIAIAREGGYVDVVLDDARSRLQEAESAVGDLPDPAITAVLRDLGSFLLTRVEAARIR
jgi:heptaprenyl diphosphate synthase